ncbi:nucleotidyltransferase domain-containing protein [Candidatus Margulisiibacteriota bacterium]
MVIDPNIEEKLSNFINKVKKNKIKVIKAYLYGSYAKGKAREDSDIDVAIISPDFSGNRFIDSLTIIPFRRKIDSRIEPVAYKPEDFEETDPLVAEIKENGFELK